MSTRILSQDDEGSIVYEDDEGIVTAVPGLDIVAGGETNVILPGVEETTAPPGAIGARQVTPMDRVRSEMADNPVLPGVQDELPSTFDLGGFTFPNPFDFDAVSDAAGRFFESRDRGADVGDALAAAFPTAPTEEPIVGPDMRSLAMPMGVARGMTLDSVDEIAGALGTRDPEQMRREMRTAERQAPAEMAAGQIAGSLPMAAAIPGAGAGASTGRAALIGAGVAGAEGAARRAFGAEPGQRLDAATDPGGIALDVLLGGVAGAAPAAVRGVRERMPAMREALEGRHAHSRLRDWGIAPRRIGTETPITPRPGERPSPRYHRLIDRTEQTMERGPHTGYDIEQQMRAVDEARAPLNQELDAIQRRVDAEGALNLRSLRRELREYADSRDVADIPALSRLVNRELQTLQNLPDDEAWSAVNRLRQQIGRRIRTQIENPDLQQQAVRDLYRIYRGAMYDAAERVGQGPAFNDTMEALQDLRVMGDLGDTWGRAERSTMQQSQREGLASVRQAAPLRQQALERVARPLRRARTHALGASRRALDAADAGMTGLEGLPGNIQGLGQLPEDVQRLLQTRSTPVGRAALMHSLMRSNPELRQTLTQEEEAETPPPWAEDLDELYQDDLDQIGREGLDSYGRDEAAGMEDEQYQQDNLRDDESGAQPEWIGAIDGLYR